MMLKAHSRIIRRSWIALEAAAAAAALEAARRVAGDGGSGVNDALASPATWAVLLIWPGALLASGAYRTQRLMPVVEQWRDLGRAHLLASVMFVALGMAGLPHHPRPRAVALFLVLSFVAIGVERSVVRQLRHLARRRGRNSRNALVIGTSVRAERFVASTTEHDDWGLRTIGLVRPSSEGTRAARDVGVPVLGELPALSALLDERVVDELVVCAPLDQEVRAAVREADMRGLVVRFVSEAHRHRAAGVGGLPGLSISTVGRTAGQELALLAKRVLDVCVAGTLLVATFPLAAGIVVMIRLDSSGPALFRQPRIGLNGRRFTMLKFRSMRLGSDTVPPDLRRRNEVSGPAFKLRDDPRVTRVGCLLRASSLDELPQLWNVFRGDMSLVGPRPPLPAEVAQYTPAQRRRLAMKPGMTGLWQVSGRSRLGFDAWLELDLAYVDRWSLSTDLRILLRTIPAVLSGRGAW